jgi:hypothetical protein
MQEERIKSSSVSSESCIIGGVCGFADGIGAWSLQTGSCIFRILFK